MPGFNQSGPMGQGAMTGRRMGKCTNFGASKSGSEVLPEQENQKMCGQGRGQGQGMRRGLQGRGNGRRF